MTVESRLRRAAAETRQAISGLEPPTDRLPRRRFRPVLGWALAAAAIMIVFLGPLLYRGHPDLEPGETLLLIDPLVVGGASSPNPDFDPSTLGVDNELADIEDAALIVDQLVGSSALRHGTEASLAKVTVVGVTKGGSIAAILRTSYSTCLYVSTPSASVCRTVGSKDMPGVNSLGLAGTITWNPLPEGTSVVTLEYGDVTLWQQPVGGVAIFDTDMNDGDQFTLTALDADGRTILIQSGVFRR